MKGALPLLSHDLVRRGPFDPWDYSYELARSIWRHHRHLRGFKSDAQYTQPGESNTKLAKSTLKTRSLTLYPWTGSGLVNVCEATTEQCRENCVLNTAGKGRMPSVVRARILRTEFLYLYPTAAVTLLAHEIQAEVKRNAPVLVRLNVASDLRWEDIAPALFDIPGTQYYDYTKLPHRNGHSNYRLLYSLSEAAHSERTALEWLESGRNVAAVFATKKGEQLPARWRGYPVIDGDTHDDRYSDPEGVVVGLRAKGSARKLQPGKFVQYAINS